MSTGLFTTAQIRARLDVGDTQYCAAAQVVCNSADESAFLGAMDELNMGPLDGVRYGFSLSISEYLDFARRLPGEDDNRKARYAPLTEAWRRAVVARLGTPCTSCTYKAVDAVDLAEHGRLNHGLVTA